MKLGNLKLDKIYCGDCLELMKDIPDNSIDLIITSPPYEDISGAGYSAITKDILFFKLYSEFINKIFTEYKRILKENGQLFFNVKSKVHNKTIKTPHWLEFTEGFNSLNFKSYIIWKYSGSFDSSNKRFHLDYEIIYHLSKGNNIYINDAYKDIRDSLSSVWYIPHYISNRLHPTQMPIKVADRIIILTSRQNDIVLDNFCGSGTSLVSAKKMGRKYLGFEINPKYVEIANERLSQVQVSML